MGYRVMPPAAMPGNMVGMFQDGRIKYASTLKRYAKRQLQQRQQPEATYQLDAADLASVRLLADSGARVGDRVRVVDENIGISILTYVSSAERDLNDPSKVKMEFETRWRTLADVLAEMVEDEVVPESPTVVAPTDIELGPDLEDLDAPPDTLAEWQWDEDPTKFDGAEIAPDTVDIDDVLIDMGEPTFGHLGDVFDPDTGLVMPEHVGTGYKPVGDDPGKLSDLTYKDPDTTLPTGNLNGAKLQRGTIPRVRYGQVTEAGVDGSGHQIYKVHEIDYTTKDATSTEVINLMVLDDTHAALTVGEWIGWLEPSESELNEDPAYLRIILPGSGGGGGTIAVSGMILIHEHEGYSDGGWASFLSGGR